MPPESCTNPPCGDLSRPTLAAAREIAELNRSTATPLEGHNKENKSDKRLPLPRSSRKVSAWPDMSGRLEGPATYSPSGERQYTLKFVLTGSSGVGKTQLASRIIRGEFDERSLPTVGMEFGTRSLRYAEHSSVRAQVWDAAGKFPLKSITEPFFAGAVGAMLVYDISRRSTFDDIVRWLALIRQNCHQSISLILVGNKSDMSSKQREVSMMEGIRFARKYGLNFVETSALRDHNVEVAARQLVMSVARYLPYERSPWSAKTPSYALPAGWVRVVVSPDGEEDENDSGRSRPNAPMPPLPPPPSQRPSLKAGNGYIVGSVVSNGSYSSSKASNNATAVPSGSYSSSRASNGNEHAMGSMVRSGSFSSRRDSDGNGTVMGSLRRTGSYSSRRDSTCSMVGGCYKEAGNGNANGHIVCSVVPNGCYSGSKASNACEKGIGRTMGTAVRSDGSYDSKSADGHAVGLFATKGSCSQGGNGNTNGYTVDSPYGSYGKAAEGNASVSGRTIGTVLRANGSYDSKTANGRTMSSFVPNSSYSKAGNGNANDDMVGAVMPTGGYSIVLYENTWTGDRYSQRPPFPAGPAEACVESQVPRAIDPLVLLEDPVKSDGGAREGRRESLKSFARRQSWSFSSLKSKGFAAASECLSRCMET